MKAPRRADAVRNREALLAAARRVFDEQGADAALDEVARRAGVGNATMYRHFPTRRELLVAVYAEEVAELCARADAAMERGGPAAAGGSAATETAAGEGLWGWLEAFAAHVATKRGLALALADAECDPSPLYDQWHQAMVSAASRLLSRAQDAGGIRADLTAHDLLALVNGIALGSGGADQRARLLRLAREGMG